MAIQDTNALISYSDNGAQAIPIPAGGSGQVMAADNLLLTLTTPPAPLTGVTWSVTLQFTGGEGSGMTPTTKTAMLGQNQSALSFSIAPGAIIRFTSLLTDASGNVARAVGTLRSALAGVTPYRGGDSDINSLVWGDVSQDEWVPVNANAITKSNAFGSVDGYSDSVVLNNLAGAAALYTYACWGCPQGVTSVAFEIDASWPSGVVSGVVTIQIRDVAGGSTLATAQCALSAGLQTFTTGPVMVVPGTNYRAYILYGGAPASNGSNVLVSRARVRVLTTSVPLLNDYVRYNATARHLWGNCLYGVTQGVFAANVNVRRQSPFSRFSFWTDAQQIGIQAINGVQANGPLGGFIGIYVNGAPYSTVRGPNGPVFDVMIATLPPGYNFVEVESSDAFGVSAESMANQVLAVLAPRNAAFQITPRPETGKDIIYFKYDSKGGYGGTIPNFTGIIPMLRRSMPHATFIHDGRVSLQVASENNTPATQQALIARMVQARAKVYVLMGYHRNDWANAALNPIAVKAQLETLIDAVHAGNPSATFLLISTWSEVSDGSTNGLGFTIQNYRDACTKDIANARPDWCTFIDGTASGIPGWNNGTCLNADNVHPNDFGYALIFTAFLQAATPLFDGPAVQTTYQTAPVEHTQGPTVLVASGGGTFAPAIANLATNNQSALLRVSCLVEDLTAHVSACLVHYVRVNNNAGTVTAGTPTVAFTDITSIAITLAYSISTTKVIATVTNNGANACTVKIRTETMLMQ